MLDKQKILKGIEEYIDSMEDVTIEELREVSNGQSDMIATTVQLLGMSLANIAIDSVEGELTEEVIEKHLTDANGVIMEFFTLVRDFTIIRLLVSSHDGEEKVEEILN